jgi:serine/threonine protein kinase
MSEWVVDLSGFDLVEVMHEKSRFPIEIHASRATGFRVAVKNFPDVDGSQEDAFFRETSALANLGHPCIVPFFGYVLRVGRVGPKIVTHFMSGGPLNGVLQSRPSWWNGTAKSIVVAGIVLGMIAVHESGFIHRDLKPSNILLDDDHRPRISDFGSSQGQSVTGTLTGGFQIGTPLYMAPELYEQEGYSEKVDVYSFALILYEIVVGRQVFSSSLTLPQLALKVAKGGRAEIPPDVDKLVADLIQRGWSASPAERPSFRAIYEDLRAHEFCIARGAFESRKVASYVNWVKGQM